MCIWNHVLKKRSERDSNSEYHKSRQSQPNTWTSTSPLDFEYPMTTQEEQQPQLPTLKHSALSSFHDWSYHTRCWRYESVHGQQQMRIRRHWRGGERDQFLRWKMTSKRETGRRTRMIPTIHVTSRVIKAGGSSPWHLFKTVQTPSMAHFCCKWRLHLTSSWLLSSSVPELLKT